MVIMGCLGINAPCIIGGMWTFGLIWLLKDIVSDIATWFQLPITLANLK